MNHSVIEHRANYYYLRLEEDYLAICHGNHCKAAILAILEQWANSKLANKLSLWTYLSYSQWEKSMFFLYKRKAIMKALAELVTDGFIKQRSFIDENNQKSYEYQLDIEVVQKELWILSEKGSPKKDNPPSQKGLPGYPKRDGGSPKKDGGLSQKGHIIDSSQNPLDSDIQSTYVANVPIGNSQANATVQSFEPFLPEDNAVFPQERTRIPSQNTLLEDSSQTDQPTRKGVAAVPRKTRKSPLNDTETAILDTWDTWANIPLDRSNTRNIAKVRYLGKHLTRIDDLALVKAEFDKDSYWSSRCDFPTFVDKFDMMLGRTKKPKGEQKPTQKYTDPQKAEDITPEYAEHIQRENQMALAKIEARKKAKEKQEQQPVTLVR